MQNRPSSTYRTTVKAPVDRVWDALTKAEIVKQYFFGARQETDWKVGSPITWTGEYEGKTYTDKGKVREYVPNQRLSYDYFSSWSGMEEKPENYLQVTYEVRPVDGGTELTITQTNYDEEKAKHTAANWAAVIDEMKKIIE